jgi:hypothetical protein
MQFLDSIMKTNYQADGSISLHTLRIKSLEICPCANPSRAEFQFICCFEFIVIPPGCVLWPPEQGPLQPGLVEQQGPLEPGP